MYICIYVLYVLLLLLLFVYKRVHMVMCIYIIMDLLWEVGRVRIKRRHWEEGG